MRRNASTILVVFLALCSAITLLQGSIALGSSQQFGDSPRTTQVVRSYYASVNRFLDGGDPEVMGDVDSVLEAVRATYPRLRFEPAEISGSGDLALVQVTAVDGESALPSWINDGVGPDFSSSIDSLYIENNHVVERQSSARIGVLAQSLAGTGVDFRIDRPSHLMAAELVLSVSDTRSAFVSVSGPSFAVPMDGSFSVKGNGLLRVANPMNGSEKLIPLGQLAVITGGEILIVPRGHAVIRPSDRSRPRLALLAMVPTSPMPKDSEVRLIPEGPESPEDVMRRLTIEQRSERIWFGTIRLLASSPVEIQSGWLSMDVTRIVVPAGEELRLSPQGYQMIALVRADDAWRKLGSFETINATNSTWMLDAVRVCWRGIGNLPQPTCADQTGRTG